MAHNRARSTSSKTIDNVPVDINDFKSINKSLDEVPGLIESISPKTVFEKTITNIVGILSKHVQLLANSCSAMSSTVDTIEVDTAKTDQYSRRNNLVLTGIEYKKETETYENLCNTVAEELSTSGVKVNNNDFSACHRNGNKVKVITQKGKRVKVPPSVTVRFYNSNKKDLVLRSYKNYNDGKPKPIKVIQSLNNYYQTLKSNISNFCREKDVKILWMHWLSSSAGLCFKFDDGTIMSRIHSMADFTKQFGNMDQ